MWYWNRLRIGCIVITACWNANGSVFIGKPKVLTRAAINQDQEFRRKKSTPFLINSGLPFSFVRKYFDRYFQCLSHLLSSESVFH